MSYAVVLILYAYKYNLGNDIQNKIKKFRNVMIHVKNQDNSKVLCKFIHIYNYTFEKLNRCLSSFKH